MKRRSGFCIYWISILEVWYILSSPKRGSTILVNIEGKDCTLKFCINEIKNLSRKSARPATIATKNQKQTMSLTTMSTEGGMYNKVL